MSSLSDSMVMCFLQYDVLIDYGFIWDSSIPVPPLTTPVWPYTLDYKWAFFPFLYLNFTEFSVQCAQFGTKNREVNGQFSHMVFPARAWWFSKTINHEKPRVFDS
jgi:hypothetical protein